MDNAFLDPRLWGPSMWLVLHVLVCLCSSTFHGKIGKEFIHVLADLLPCETCERNFKQFLKLHPLRQYWLCSAKRMGMWLNLAHNEVNRRNGKPAFTWPQHQTRIAQLMATKDWRKDLITTCYYLFEHFPELDRSTVALRGQYRRFIRLLVRILEPHEPAIAQRFFNAFVAQDPELCDDGHHKLLPREKHDVWRQTACLQSTLHKVETETWDADSIVPLAERLQMLRAIS